MLRSALIIHSIYSNFDTKVVFCIKPTARFGRMRSMCNGYYYFVFLECDKSCNVKLYRKIPTFGYFKMVVWL